MKQRDLIHCGMSSVTPVDQLLDISAAQNRADIHDTIRCVRMQLVDLHHRRGLEFVAAATRVMQQYIGVPEYSEGAL